MANYPLKRLRRLRYNPLVRDMVRETILTKDDFIYPLFAVPGEKIKNPIQKKARRDIFYEFFRDIRK